MRSMNGGAFRPGRLCDYSGITYELSRTWRQSSGHLPQATQEVKTARALCRRQISDRRRQGQADLRRVEAVSRAAHREFPFILNTGRTVEHWHTRTKTGRCRSCERLSPRAWLEMNPADAQSLSCSRHDRVDVVSRRGRVRNVELRITEIIAPGQVFMPFHFAETNANQVTQSAFDPISREPNYKQCAVRVEKSKVGLKDRI